MRGFYRFLNNKFFHKPKILNLINSLHTPANASITTDIIPPPK